MMQPPTNQDDHINTIINEIWRAWKSHPEMRFCQLINAITLTEHIFYINDEEFKSMITRFNEGL